MFEKKLEKPKVEGKHTNKAIGNYGEKLAVKYLKKQGYQIVKTNYRLKIGEVDIIALDGEWLVFVEVKYRSTALYGMPNEAVDKYKREKIRRVALQFLQLKSMTDAYVRFDVVQILGDEIQLLKNAF